MVAEIINVGSEILIGDILNTNSRFLSLKLYELGIDVHWHTVVGDNEERLKLAVEIALKRSDIIIITGGLGPTQDDITKQVVAKTINMRLVEDFNIRKKIEEKFKLMNADITENNYKQSFIFRDGVVFENLNGTAPAMAIKFGEKIILLLPGPPDEIESFFENGVESYLKQFSGDYVIFSKNIYIFGITESKVDELLFDLLNGKNPSVGIYAKDGQVRLRVTAKAKDIKNCREMVSKVVFKIKNRLKNKIYGVDVLNMQTALFNSLKLKNKTISVAESCTGGLICSNIVEISGVSDFFKLGVVCYSNEAKEKIIGVKRDSLEKFGAVSFKVAKEMAQGVRKISNSDIAISTTGIAGPFGGNLKKPVGLVYIGISTKKQTKVYKLLLSRGEKDERNKIRKMAAFFAMNEARKEILKEEI